MKKIFKNKKIAFAVVFVTVIILVIGFRGVQKLPSENFFHRITAPVATFFSNSGAWAKSKISFFTSIKNLKQENEKMYYENISLRASLAELKDIKKENEELRKEIQLAPRGEYELEATLVIGKDLSGKVGVVLIDKGEKDGIKNQMAVVVGKGYLVGKVIEVFPTSSRVELLLSRDLSVNAEIVESGAKGIVRGSHRTSVAMDMIPQTVEVNKGDTVITSGVGNVLPRGLLIGYSQDPIPTADQLFQKTSINSPVQFDNLRVAWVVKGLK